MQDSSSTKEGTSFLITLMVLMEKEEEKKEASL